MILGPLPIPTRLTHGEGIENYAIRHAQRNGTPSNKSRMPSGRPALCPNPVPDGIPTAFKHGDDWADSTTGPSKHGCLSAATPSSSGPYVCAAPAETSESAGFRPSAGSASLTVDGSDRDQFDIR